MEIVCADFLDEASLHQKTKNISSLVLEQRADAGCVRHGKRIAMSEASVYGHLVASHLLGGHTGSLISVQAEDALLILRELGGLYPSHIVASWKPHDDLVPFHFLTFEDGLDFDDSFVPVRVVLGDALRGGRLWRSPPMNTCDASADYKVRGVQPVLQLSIGDLVFSLVDERFACAALRRRCHVASDNPMP